MESNRGLSTAEIKKLIDEIRGEINDLHREISDKEAEDIIEAKLLGAEELTYAEPKVKRKMVQSVFLSIRKELSILDSYLKDREINEIMVNGKDCIFIEKSGTLFRIDEQFHSVQELEEVIRRIAAGVHKEINELNPILDARLEDGARVNAVYKNIAPGGPILTIRRFPEKAITMEMLIEKKSITREGAEFLKILVGAGYNIFISGGTSSGKTTFLNALSNFIPKHERVIVIEDSAELQIQGIENLVRMECKSANNQGRGGVDMKQLIKASLRMRPDRIIVGEVRGEEVIDMIQAMNTGHDGSLSTGHGNSASGMINRLEAMFLQGADFPISAIRRQIAEAIDIIVHLGRLSTGRRAVLGISEVEGVEGENIKLNCLYENCEGGELEKTGNKLKRTEKLALRGVNIYEELQ